MNSKDHAPTIIEAHGLTSEEYNQIKKYWIVPQILLN